MSPKLFLLILVLLFAPSMSFALPIFTPTPQYIEELTLDLYGDPYTETAVINGQGVNPRDEFIDNTPEIRGKKGKNKNKDKNNNKNKNQNSNFISRLLKGFLSLLTKLIGF